MLKGIISYSLFENDKVFNHRKWDMSRHEKWRYWTNIPAIVLVNHILFPEFETVFHVTPKIKEHPLYHFLQALSNSKLITTNVIELPYENTEPSLWRFEPLFNRKAEIVLSRDIDSLICTSEYLAIQQFLQDPTSNFSTIRSHTNHRYESTKLLAGLTAFKVKEFELESFENFYLKSRDPKWGVDQNAIIDRFLNNASINLDSFLDVAISSRNHNVSKPLGNCKSITEKELGKASIDDRIRPLLTITDKISTWPGQPVDSRPVFKSLCEQYPNPGDEINRLINTSEDLFLFYNPTRLDSIISFLTSLVKRGS